MRRLALLVTHEYYPGRPDRDDPDFARSQLARLEAACAPRGIEVEPAFWQDDGVDWSRFDAASPLMAWNYPRTPDVLLARLAEAEAAGARVLNPIAVVRANMDKGYLARLSAAGAPVPPTCAIDAATPDAIRAAVEALGADEVIVKPRIGAGAWRQARILRGGPIPDGETLPPDGALVQPFLPAVTREGELSLLYFAGRFSHALLKTPKAGDYRTQGQFGAVERPLEPPPEAMEAAERVLELAEARGLTYARVDLVRAPDGRFLLMELELIEPWLYLAHDGVDGARAGALFARAVDEALEAGPGR